MHVIILFIYIYDVKFLSYFEAHNFMQGASFKNVYKIMKKIGIISTRIK